MIVSIIYVDGVVAIEFERDTPVATNPHRPCAATAPTEFMKVQAGQTHILRGCRRMQATQNKPNSIGMSRLNPGPRTTLEKTF
jgi:hypothetical protein